MRFLIFIYLSLFSFQVFSETSGRSDFVKSCEGKKQLAEFNCQRKLSSDSQVKLHSVLFGDRANEEDLKNIKDYQEWLEGVSVSNPESPTIFENEVDFDDIFPGDSVTGETCVERLQNACRIAKELCDKKDGKVCPECPKEVRCERLKDILKAFPLEYPAQGIGQDIKHIIKNVFSQAVCDTKDNSEDDCIKEDPTQWSEHYEDFKKVNEFEMCNNEAQKAFNKCETEAQKIASTEADHCADCESAVPRHGEQEEIEEIVTVLEEQVIGEEIYEVGGEEIYEVGADSDKGRISSQKTTTRSSRSYESSGRSDRISTSSSSSEEGFLDGISSWFSSSSSWLGPTLGIAGIAGAGYLGYDTFKNTKQTNQALGWGGSYSATDSLTYGLLGGGFYGSGETYGPYNIANGVGVSGQIGFGSNYGYTPSYNYGYTPSYYNHYSPYPYYYYGY